MSGKGLHLAKKAKPDMEPERVWLSGPFEVLGACRDPQGKSWGKWLSWRDGDKRLHTRQIGDDVLQGDAAALCAKSRA